MCPWGLKKKEWDELVQNVELYRETKSRSLLLDMMTEEEKDLAILNNDDKFGQSVSVVAPVRKDIPCDA